MKWTVNEDYISLQLELDEAIEPLTLISLMPLCVLLKIPYEQISVKIQKKRLRSSIVYSSLTPLSIQDAKQRTLTAKYLNLMYKSKNGTYLDPVRTSQYSEVNNIVNFVFRKEHLESKLKLYIDALSEFYPKKTTLMIDDTFWDGF